jgi:hypothetical protein
MSEALHRTTQMITEVDLPRMVLDRGELPPALGDFIPAQWLSRVFPAVVPSAFAP